MMNINQENDLPQQRTQRQQEDNHHREREEEEENQEPKHQENQREKQEPKHQKNQREKQEPKHQENREQEQETERVLEGEERKQEEPEELQSQPEPDRSVPLTTMPSSPELSPMFPPPNQPTSPPDSAPSPDLASHAAHFVSPPPSTLSSYQTSYSYNHNEPSPPLQVLKTPPSPPPPTTKLGGAEEDGGGNGAGGSGKRLRPNLSVLRRAKMENIKRRTLLVFRIFGFLFCLVSLSVMAADKNQGWALDSFHRYKEFRYCMSVNVIGFVYSGLQAYDLAYSLTTGKQVVRNQFRCLLDFSLDQILAYLLLSASSSSAFRVEDWESNWGKDKFPAMARASVALSFLAFVAFALSSLLSGYTLFTPHSW